MPQGVVVLLRVEADWAQFMQRFGLWNRLGRIDFVAGPGTVFAIKTPTTDDGQITTGLAITVRMDECEPQSLDR